MRGRGAATAAPAAPSAESIRRLVRMTFPSIVPTISPDLSVMADLFRPSTSLPLQQRKAWKPGRKPGKTAGHVRFTRGSRRREQVGGWEKARCSVYPRGQNRARRAHAATYNKR